MNDSDAFASFLLYAGLVVVPVSVYFYVFHGDWYLLYTIDTARVPSALALIGTLALVGVGAGGFLFGASLVRSQREQWAGAAVGVTISMALGVLPLARHRLAVVGSYAQFHGDFGPGGGFQAGVITAGMVVLLAITFGLEAARRIAPQALVERMIPLGVLIYAGTGVAGLLMGKNYLDYSVLAHDSAHGHELGIFLVEAGVLITVAGTMTALFYAFVERGR